MAQIGTMTIDLIAETASFNANIKKAAATLNSEATQMRRSLDQVNAGISTIVNAGKALAGAAVVGEVTRLAGAGLNYASSLGEVAQQLGVTTDLLQTMRYAATQVGISQEEMDKGLSKLTRTLGEAQLGSKSAQATFAALGVSITDSSGRFRDTTALFPEIADALAKIPDPARRAALEVDLFGKSGQKLDTLLAGGSAAMRELENAARDLGIVLSSDQIQKADAAADKLAEVKMVLEAQIAGVVANNVAAILQFADSLAVASSEAVKFVQRIGDIQRGADSIKKNKGYWSFLTTSIKDIQAEGAFLRKRDEIMSADPLADVRRRPIAAAVAGPEINLPRGIARSRGGRRRGGGGPSSAARDAAAAQRELETALDRVIGKFDPAVKAAADYAETLADIRRLVDAGKISGGSGIEYLLKASGAVAVSPDNFGKGSDWVDALLEQQEAVKQAAYENEKATTKIKESWADASQSVLSSLQGLKFGIQSGDFLDVLTGVTDLLLQLGSIGLFGSKISTNIKGARGFSTGGYTGSMGTSDVAGVVHGQEYVFDAAAVKRLGIENLERLRRGAGFMAGGYTGGAIRRVSGMERAARVEIVPSPYFDATVDGRAQTVAAPMAARAAQAGSSDAQQSIARARRNQIPGRR